MEVWESWVGVKPCVASAEPRIPPFLNNTKRIHCHQSYHECQRNQDLVLTLTQEIRKSVDDSMEGVVSCLRSKCTVINCELQSIKDSQPEYATIYNYW